jgi:two-component system, NtrC family, response regulator AtoC
MTPFLFGSNDRMKDLERKIAMLARSGLPVLIEGACGSGKEALAELLHQLSGAPGDFTRVLCRQSGPVVHGAAGSANGAGDLSQLYSSCRGTLFLKGIHLLSPAVQEQFLSALEQSTDSFDGKSGLTAPRLVSSATEPLEPFVSRQAFHAALYYRLSVYRVSLPPLRERAADIPELFARMVERAANGESVPPPPARLIDTLMAYEWPGNLRELSNVARAYVVAGEAEEIMAELGSRSHARRPPVAAEPDRLSLKERVRGASQKLESEIILRTLEQNRWNRRRAAQSLKISYRSLLYKMKNCNLRVETQTTPGGE